MGGRREGEEGVWEEEEGAGRVVVVVVQTIESAPCPSMVASVVHSQNCTTSNSKFTRGQHQV